MKKLKDVAKELGINPLEAYRTMKRVCDMENCRKAKDGWELEDSEVEHLKAAHDTGLDELTPRFIKAYVIRATPNPRFVECCVYGEPGKFPVSVPMMFKPNQLVGKFIGVEVIEQADGKKFYRHEKLSKARRHA